MTKNTPVATEPRVAADLARLLVPIAELTPDPANVRLHGERSVDAIAASLSRFGQQKPVVVDARGVVIAGNGMLEAAKKLGWDQIAAVRSKLGGAERIAYGIADNRTAELSTWDDDALRAVLGELPEDLAASAGFAKDELERLFAGVGAGVSQDTIPAVGKHAVSRAGDLWILGDQRLLCGDCTDPEAVARVMTGEKAVLFATDPPYLVDYDGTNHPQTFAAKPGTNARKGGGNKDWSGTYGKTWDDADAGSELYDRFLAAAVPHLAETAAWYCWHASRRQAKLETAWEKAGAFVHCQIIWAKNRPVLTRTWYLWQHEPCLFGWKVGKKPPKAPGSENRSTVWTFDTLPNTEDRPEHPTPKPIELFAIPMQQHTREGGICYEPFSGSGTQIIAAEQLGRRCRAIEIEPLYVDVAVRRWEALTGKEARLEGGRKTWSQVMRERLKGGAASGPSRSGAPSRSSGPGSRTRTHTRS